MKPWKLTFIYGGAFAALALIVAILSMSYAAPGLTRHVPVFGLAVIFSALGIWFGWRVKPQGNPGLKKTTRD